MATGRVPTTANSPLTTKGDLFTYDTSQARLAVGSNGETLVADSSTSTGLRYNPQNALANVVINGGMDVWQRGTSFSSPNAIYVADRWKAEGSTPACTVSRQATGDTTNLPNIQYGLRFQRNSGQTNTSAVYLYTGIETANAIPLAGKAITVSFYAKAGANYSSASSILSYFLNTGTGTDESPSGAYTGNVSAASGNVTLTTSYQRFAFTATIGATATEFKIGFNYTPVGTAGANDWFEVTGVQIDLGTYTKDTAPTFRRSGGNIAGELAACQRYYQRIRGDEGNAGTTNPIALGSYYNTTIYRAIVRFPVKMRKIPDFSSANSANYFQIVGNGATTGYAATTLDIASPDTASLNVTVSGATAGTSAWLQTSNASSFVDFSAEL